MKKKKEKIRRNIKLPWYADMASAIVVIVFMAIAGVCFLTGARGACIVFLCLSTVMSVLTLLARRNVKRQKTKKKSAIPTHEFSLTVGSTCLVLSILFFILIIVFT